MSVSILKLFGALKPPQVTFVYKVIYQLGAKRYLKPFDHPDQLKRDYLLAGSRVFLFVVIFILWKKLLLQLEIPFNFRLIKRATDMA